MDKISDAFGEDILNILDELKESYNLDVAISVALTDEPFILAKTVREDDGYRIFLCEDERYLLLHEFYHILVEERLMRKYLGSSCDFCAKIALEMLNVLVDLAIENIIHQADPGLFPSFFPKIKENLNSLVSCGAICFDPARTVAYNLYLEAAILELYPELMDDYDFWSRLPEYADIDQAIKIGRRFLKRRSLLWSDIIVVARELSWATFRADIVFIESDNQYRISCNTDHRFSKRIVDDLIGYFKKLSLDWPG